MARVDGDAQDRARALRMAGSASRRVRRHVDDDPKRLGQIERRAGTAGAVEIEDDARAVAARRDANARSTQTPTARSPTRRTVARAMVNGAASRPR